MAASPVTGEGEQPFGYTVFKKSPKETFDFLAGKADFEVVFDGPWVNRHRFIFEHILPSTFDADGTVLHSAGAAYPEYPFAKAYKAEVEGLLKTGKTEEGVISHDIARITIHYSTPDFVPGDDGGQGGGGNNPDPIYVVESVESETEIIPLPARKFTYAYLSNGQVTDYESYYNHPDAVVKKATERGKVNYLKKVFTYKLKLPYVIFPRWGYIDAFLGSVNRAPFITPSGLFAPPGTLLYDGIGAITKRELSTSALAWEIDYIFKYYRPGWNTFPEVKDDGSTIVHSAIKPMLFPFRFHQLIFANVSMNRLIDWTQWYIQQSSEFKDKFQNPQADLTFTPEEIREFNNMSIAENIWRN